MRRAKKFASFSIFAIALLLSLAGIVFVYTGSYFYCVRRGIPPYAFALKQSVALALGVFIALFLYRFFDYRQIAVEKKYLWGIYGIANALLVAVLLFGREVNNSKSWLYMAGFSIQPAEIAKVFIILFVSGYIRYKWYEIHRDIKFFMAFVTLSFVPVLLILLERDLGSAMILSVVMFAIFFITGFNLRYVAYPAVLGTAMFSIAIATAPYRLARIKMLLDPAGYLHTGGRYDSHQLVQAFVAFAKGGLTGMGIGQGTQSKFQFLSLSFSDFMYAHIAEEAGAIGALLVLLAFFFILYLGLSIADRTDEKVGKFMALGLTLHIFLQAVVHIGVNLGLLPTAGITLPFLSLGGTSLVSMFIAVGMLMNIARFLPEETRTNIQLLERGKLA